MALEAGYGCRDSVMNTLGATGALGRKGKGKGKGIARSERQGSILAGFGSADGELDV